MKNIVLIAPPASGKGTQAELIKDKYNIPHISTGDLLRAKALEDNETGRHIKEVQASGGLVDISVTTNLLEERLNRADCDMGYILDGYPRNMEQVKALEDILKTEHKEIGYVIYLKIDKEIALKRTLGRSTCSKCGATYNDNNPERTPKQAGKCDVCGTELIKRSDDNEEAFIKRFDTYMTNTEPVIDYYRNLGLLYEVNGGAEISETFIEIQDIINK